MGNKNNEWLHVVSLFNQMRETGMSEEEWKNIYINFHYAMSEFIDKYPTPFGIKVKSIDEKISELKVLIADVKPVIKDGETQLGFAMKANPRPNKEYLLGMSKKVDQLKKIYKDAFDELKRLESEKKLLQ